MKVVIVDRKNASVVYKNSRIFVDNQGIPLRMIEFLILHADVTLQSKDILKLSKEGISILYISKNNKDMALTVPLAAKNSELKQKQYEALGNKLGLAKYFIDEKVKRHIAHLKSIGIDTDVALWLQRINQSQSIESLLGEEGSFSRYYFKYYFSQFSPNLHKGKRSKRPAMDPVNATLSYLYSIIYNLLTVKLYSSGFDPAISYLHQPFRSHYALSSDFMELFRAQINEKVLDWFHDKTLGAEDFTAKNGVFIRYESRKKLWLEIKSLMTQISSEADREISLLRAAIS